VFRENGGDIVRFLSKVEAAVEAEDSSGGDLVKRASLGLYRVPGLLTLVHISGAVIHLGQARQTRAGNRAKTPCI
jgi:hypothetical protein